MGTHVRIKDFKIKKKKKKKKNNIQFPSLKTTKWRDIPYHPLQQITKEVKQNWRQERRA